MADTATSRRRSAERRLLRAIENRTARGAVLGLGFVGSTLMDALRAAGYEVHGYDRSEAAANAYRERSRVGGVAGGKPWSAGSDEAALAEADVVVVAVRVAVGDDGSIELEPLRSAAVSIRSLPRDQRLVLLESTVPPGVTREFAGWLESAAGEVFVAHGPERLSVGHDWRALREMPHLVGGVDPEATALAARLLSDLCEVVVPVSRPEVSELSKLLENAFLTVGIGLVGEITRMAHALDVSAREVTEAAATKPAGYYAFHPGPGVGGHCLRNDLEMLRHAARRLGWEPSLIEGTAAVTAAHPRVVVDRLAALLSRVGGDLTGSRILLVGMGFKVGTADTSASPAHDVVRLLRSRGAVPVYLDSRVVAVDVDGQAVPRVSNADLGPGRYAAVVVLAGDARLSAQELRELGCLVLDTGGGRILAGAAEAFTQL